MNARAGGGIELERSLDSIIVGARHRSDFGDLDALAASIERDGLLQPPTITPHGVLVCGARRLAAIRQLGWRTVNVWVRSGLSDRLGQLMAEQDDNVLHKPLTALEAASLYRELKAVMAEDAARRQTATRFSSAHQPGDNGAGKYPAPSENAGRAREQAAAMIPGGTSYKTLECINFLQRIAEDPEQSEVVRATAGEALASIENGAPVYPAYERLRAVVDAGRVRQDVDLHALAEEALARAKAARARSKASRNPASERLSSGSARWPVRAFVLTWAELDGWWEHYDVDELATELTSDQLVSFLETAAGTARFADRLRTIARLPDEPERPPLRAV
ncbi:ParB-like nuclease [Microbacterium sp. HM58-2]|nr:ParB-like nuclease [Microbacterium sp. HM58-2]